jgi:hypothetical protein
MEIWSTAYHMCQKYHLKNTILKSETLYVSKNRESLASKMVANG